MCVCVITSAAFACLHAQPVAKITVIEGQVSVMKKGTSQWRNAKPGIQLDVGDQLYTYEESFAEIRYSIGTVLRMDEKTKVTIEASSEKTIKTKTSMGNVWVNMKKLISTGKQFEVSTPTAVAAIRGTVFDFSYTPDSATYVNVFEGKVAVGPTNELKKKIEKEKKESAKIREPQEVPGPEEIPGPYEVSLEQWLTIVEGQRISIQKNGKYAIDKINMEQAQKEKFIKKNLMLDENLNKK
jgi:ferric-dicitrate binding protein FerR (iron transport regulator)